MPPPGTRPGTPQGGGRDEPGRLTPEGFAARLQGCTPALWTAAAGILGDRVGAEDVVQEAALIGLRKLESFEPGTSFTAWMGRIVRNVALNHARRITRRQTHPTEGEVLDAHPSPDRGQDPRVTARLAAVVDDAAALGSNGASSAADGLFEGDLAEALSELRPVVRACLVLKTVLELEYREIGALLDVPEGTAMSHVHRARRQLRKRLSVDQPSLEPRR